MSRPFLARCLQRSREIAATPGIPRTVAVLTGVACGVAHASAGYLNGGHVLVAIVSAVVFSAAFSAMGIFAFAQSQLMFPETPEPRPARTPAEFQATMARVQTVSLAMAVMALALSGYALLR